MELDAADKKLLQGLDRNVRTSLTQLAKHARISKEKAHYRIDRLEQRGIITGYWAQQRLGRSTPGYKIFLKDKSLGKKRAQIIAFLLDHPEAAWIAETNGTWDFIVSSYVKHDHEFTAFAQELIDRFGKHLQRKAIIKITKAISLNEKYLHEDGYTRISEDDFTKGSPDLDEIDAVLVNELAKNARATYADLAEHVPITPEAVSPRVRNLLETAFTDLKVRISHAALGLGYYHVMLSLADPDKKEWIINHYAHHPNCVYMMTHLGMYDIHLEIVIRPDGIQDFLTELSEICGGALTGYEVLEIVEEHRMTIQH